MLNENLINYFLTLCDTLNFTEAAKRLYVSQQSVSKSIMQLESDLGIRLLNRNSKGVSLTESGVKVEKLFREQKSVFEKTILDIKSDVSKKMQTLNIGLQDYLDLGSELIEANTKMRNDYPELYLKTERYSPGLLNSKLEDGSLDVLVIIKRYLAAAKSIVSKPLLDSRVNIIVSATHPLATPDATWLDFVNEPFICDMFPGETEDAFQKRVEKEISTFKLRPLSIISTPNRESAYTTASLGYGVILGTDISQIHQGNCMLRYRTNTTTYVCCAWLADSNKEYINIYADTLSEFYNKSYTGSES